MKYVLIDTANMFFRARHVAFRAADTWEKIGYALHITLSATSPLIAQYWSQLAFDARQVSLCSHDCVQLSEVVNSIIKILF